MRLAQNLDLTDNMNVHRFCKEMVCINIHFKGNDTLLAAMVKHHQNKLLEMNETIESLQTKLFFFIF